jgi:hypothetical protein
MTPQSWSTASITMESKLPSYVRRQWDPIFLAVRKHVGIDILIILIIISSVQQQPWVCFVSGILKWKDRREETGRTTWSMCFNHHCK